MLTSRTEQDSDRVARTDRPWFQVRIAARWGLLARRRVPLQHGVCRLRFRVPSKSGGSFRNMLLGVDPNLFEHHGVVAQSGRAVVDVWEMNVDARRTGRIFGWLFIGTFITSIPARLLFVDGLGASWSDVRFIPGATSVTSLKLGALLELGLIVTNIATAVVLYPLVKRQSPRVSLGYVSARIMESVFIAIGLLSIISVANVSDALVGASRFEATALRLKAAHWCQRTNGPSFSGPDSWSASGTA